MEWLQSQPFVAISESPMRCQFQALVLIMDWAAIAIWIGAGYY